MFLASRTCLAHRSCGTCGWRGRASDVEAERPELLAAVLGDLVGAPRGHRDPVDRDVADEALEGRLGLVSDHVGQRAGRRGEGHVEDGVAVLVEVHAVDEAEVDDVDPELGVDDVLHRLGDVVDGHRRRATALPGRGHVGEVAVVDALGVGHEGAPSDWAWVVASFHAIQESRAHFTRAGNLATPANAMPSSRTSSSGSTCPLPCMSSRKVWWIPMASSTGLPITRSVSTDAEACEMEQPTLSYDTSCTTPSARCTRRVTSSPQVGLTWCTSDSNGSRSPLWCGFL